MPIARDLREQKISWRTAKQLLPQLRGERLGHEDLVRLVADGRRAAPEEEEQHDARPGRDDAHAPRQLDD